VFFSFLIPNKLGNKTINRVVAKKIYKILSHNNYNILKEMMIRDYDCFRKRIVPLLNWQRKNLQQFRTCLLD